MTANLVRLLLAATACTVIAVCVGLLVARAVRVA